jgi:hypothetical protein
MACEKDYDNGMVWILALIEHRGAFHTVLLINTSEEPSST